ncbi:cation diffusion facilitator family transporter [Microbacterium sp. A1-JK]|uniref:cation diffusion facilitator family transporter n=1 Tax=Microbacterium sp. A1-JK TaxID=3177516 RepID=UPI00388A04F5
MTAEHSHGSKTTPRSRLVIAFSITASVFIVEVFGAVLTGSLALLVDAAHMLTDVIGLALALTAANLMNRKPSDRHTWGFRRAEVLGALTQAALLFGVGMFALVEGVRRLFEPPEIASGSLLLFGIIGLIANVVALVVLTGGRSENLNMRAAFLEVLNDALGSVAVIVSAILISTLGWNQSDALAGIAISLLIVPRTVVLMRASGSVLLETTPKGLDLADVRAHLLELPHVVEVHDMHASHISTDLPVLTAHVVVEDEYLRNGDGGALLRSLQQCVAEHFPISVEHSTFQIEPASYEEDHLPHG